MRLRVSLNTCHGPGDQQRQANPRPSPRAASARAEGRHRCVQRPLFHLPCTVRDISDTGARLRIDGSINAPDKFDLIIEIDGLEVPCEVVSRKGSEISVRFISPPCIKAPRRVQIVQALVPTKPPTLRRQPKPATNS
jgi:PilZ domain